MLELLVNQVIITPSSPAHLPQILCIVLGQKRACGVAVIIFPMAKVELTSSYYLLEHVYYSYILLYDKEDIF